MITDGEIAAFCLGLGVAGAILLAVAWFVVRDERKRARRQADAMAAAHGDVPHPARLFGADW